MVSGELVEHLHAVDVYIPFDPAGADIHVGTLSIIEFIIDERPYYYFAVCLGLIDRSYSFYYFSDLQYFLKIFCFQNSDTHVALLSICSML